MNCGKAFLFGDVCIDQCPEGYYTLGDSNRCYKKVQRIDNNSWPKTCKKEVPSMFFSWCTYEEVRGRMQKVWGESLNDKRLNGCGDWEVSQIIYNFQKPNKTRHDELESWEPNHRQYVMFMENKAIGHVVIAFKGTEKNLDDWIDNVKMEPRIECPWKTKDHDCGKIHKGFYDAFKIIKEESFAQTLMYLKQGYKIILAGHSKGGPLAAMYASNFLVEYPEFRDSFSLQMFGTPRTGNFAFARSVEAIVPEIQRFTTANGKKEDMVANIPPLIGGYEDISETIFLFCEKKYFLNPQSIRDITVSYLPKSTPLYLIPYRLGCHFQQAYMDPLVNRKN